MRDVRMAVKREAGFSLIELMMAMVITLVITGAIYGLIAGGQTAFRREPEMAERQQNIRMAMDVIMKDIANAGSGLPTFVQNFTPLLDGPCSPPTCPLGPDGVETDEIEILTNSEARDTEPICRTPGTPPAPPIQNGDDVRLIRDLTGVNPLLPNTVVVPFTASGQWTLRSVVGVAPIGTAAFDCTAGAHTWVDLLTPDPTGLNTGGTDACDPNGWGNTTLGCQLVGLSFANLVRYRIRPDGAGVPTLERWSSDGPGAFAAGVRGPFQTIARGIENLQVQYLRADGNPNLPADWLDDAPVVLTAPPAPPAAAYASLVTQVRVTLAARSEAQNIAGATTSATARDAIRGSLMSSASPRATLMNITLASPAAPVLWR